MSDMKNSEHEPAPVSWRDKTLKAAGYSYLLGDAAMFASGMVKMLQATLGQEKKAAKYESLTGALWGLGGLAAARYGNPDTEKQLEILAHRLEAHMNKQGAKLPDAERANVELLAGKNGFIAKAERFLYQHPSEILNAVYLIGSGTMIGSGIFSKKGGATEKIAMGGLVAAGALAGLLIKEDPDARTKADPNSLMSRTAAFIQEKPLRLTSTLYWGNNIFAALKARKEQLAHVPGTSAIKPYMLSYLCAASYILANGLLSLSSRDQIQEKKFTSEHIAKLEEVAAEIIAAQPPQLQAALLTDVSRYLANEKMIDVSAEELSKQLLARVGQASQQHLTQATDASWAVRSAANDSVSQGVA